jgi:membrane-bound lytic murein transglycosylase D
VTPPATEPSPFVKESPTFLANASQTPKSNPLDQRIVRADEHYLNGKRLFQSGDAAGARREFDAAIDSLLAAPGAGDRPKLERKLEELVEQIYHYDVDKLGAGETSEEPSYDRAPLDELSELTFPIDPKLRSQVKDEIAATSSQLPLQENDAVISFINYFSSERGRRVLQSGLRRAGRYRPLIQRILDEEGVPQELIFLAQAESGFYPRALSRKSAAGMWQFMAWRGREYGLEQTSSTDDRLDPEKATRAAARHLRDLYKSLGDWYLALAAYNCGPACVERAVQRTGYADFWELRARNALPTETSNYVPIILAMTIMAKNAKDYNLEAVDPDPPLEYDTIELAAPTSLALISDALERSTAEVREINPALLRGVAPAGYPLRVPKGSGTTLQATLEHVPAEKRASWRVHKVSAGDTLASISKRYGSSPSSIAGANPRQADDLEAGDVLLIPCTYVEPREKAKSKYAASSRHARSHRRTAHTGAHASASKKKSSGKARTSVNARTLHRKAAVKRASR